MTRELLQDYLLKSGMNEPQAEALSRLFAHVATKDDLLNLGERLQADIRMVKADFLMLERTVKADLQVLEHKMDSKIESLKADLTWRIIGSLVLLATLMTLLDAFID
jgi:hypothetical protein